VGRPLATAARRASRRTPPSRGASRQCLTSLSRARSQPPGPATRFLPAPALRPAAAQVLEGTEGLLAGATAAPGSTLVRPPSGARRRPALTPREPRQAPRATPLRRRLQHRQPLRS
jgi:hypothetical protein